MRYSSVSRMALLFEKTDKPCGGSRVSNLCCACLCVLGDGYTAASSLQRYLRGLKGSCCCPQGWLCRARLSIRGLVSQCSSYCTVSVVKHHRYILQLRENIARCWWTVSTSSCAVFSAFAPFAVPAAAPGAGAHPESLQQLRGKIAAEELARQHVHAPSPRAAAVTASAQGPKPLPTNAPISVPQADDEQYTQYVINNYYNASPNQSTPQQPASAPQVLYSWPVQHALLTLATNDDDVNSTDFTPC